MKKKLLECLRTLEHNVKYKENYFRNVMILLLLVFILDLLMLWRLR